MIKAGTSLCVYCGKTMEEAYYFNPDNNLWVILGKTIHGKYGVVQFTPEGCEKDESAEYKNFKLVTSIKRNEIAVKDKIEVSYKMIKDDINGQKAEMSFNSQTFIRSCPFCYNNGDAQNGQSVIREIWPGMGKLPTYVIAVIGDRAVGKSSWLQALGCVENQNAIKQEYMIKTVELVSEKEAFGESTKNFQDGKSQMLKISTRGDNSQPVANVLILDFPGEIFDKNNFNAFKLTPAYSLFNGTESYSGVDAVVFMDDAKEDSDIGVIKAYNSVSDFGLLVGKPVAYVMNKIDLKMQEMQKKRDATRAELIKAKADAETAADIDAEKVEKNIRTLMDRYAELSILTEDTFKCGKQDYSKSVLLQRICLETSIATRLRSLVEYIINSNSRTAAFLIKSAEPENQKKDEGSKSLKTGVLPNLSDEYPGVNKDDKNSYRNNFENPINVMDPLLWILNELDIFPIER